LRDRANYVYDGSGCPFRVSGYNDGQWHHVAYVVDAAGGRLYVDGLLKGSLPWTGTPGPPSTTQPVHLAHYAGGLGGGYFPGLLDEVRIFNHALSEAGVRALPGVGGVAGGSLETPSGTLSATALDTASGTIAAWALDDGSGTVAADGSGYGHTGTHASALNAYPLTVGVWMKTSFTSGIRGVVNKYVVSSYNGWSGQEISGLYTAVLLGPFTRPEGVSGGSPG
jgi:trimeric autotransporter adhesin